MTAVMHWKVVVTFIFIYLYIFFCVPGEGLFLVSSDNGIGAKEVLMHNF